MTAPQTPSAPQPATLPVVRLLPKANDRAIRHGFPWVYANELVVDRRTRGLAPGALAQLEDAERRPMGLVAVNASSKIIARMIDRDPDAQVNQAWFEAHIARALALRNQLYDQPYYRLVHAEADGLPGVIIDRFGDTCVVQPNAAWADTLLDVLVAALQSVTGVKNVLKNASGRTRKLEGLDDVSSTLVGDLPEGPLPVPMNGATYMADLTGGQKTGLFYDQRPNHALPRTLRTMARGCWMFSPMSAASLSRRWPRVPPRRSRSTALLPRSNWPRPAPRR